MLVNVKPHGSGDVGLDFHNAGGVRALMKELESRLHTDCLTVSGGTVGENLKSADLPYDRDIIRPLDDPLTSQGGIAVLRGNLAPRGAVLKRSAASERLMRHRGPAKVFDDMDACRDSRALRAPISTKIRSSCFAVMVPAARRVCPRAETRCRCRQS